MNAAEWLLLIGLSSAFSLAGIAVAWSLALLIERRTR